MEIVKPQVELWVQDDPMAHVARCARVCYASDKTTGNEAMYQRLIDANHKSMLRHESVYMIAPGRSDRHEILDAFEFCPYVDFRTDYDNNEIYISTNKQFYMENECIQYFGEWIVTPEEFAASKFGKEIMRYTFKVVTQISTSRELNRVSPNNIAEQSTRYVNLSKKGGAICQPWWMTDETVKVFNTTTILPDGFYSANEETVNYCWHCDSCFQVYNKLISKGMKPQDARGVLPLDTATVCIYTYSIAEWRHIIDLRYYGTTGAAHPNAVIIAGMIREKLIELGYEFQKTKEEN